MANNFLIEQHILQIKAEIDATMISVRQTGKKHFVKDSSHQNITKVTQLLNQLNTQLDELSGTYDYHRVYPLLKISFNGFDLSHSTPKTRLEEWFRVQVETDQASPDTQKLAQVYAKLDQHCQSMHKKEATELTDPGEIVVQTEMRQKSDLVLAVPFLQRMLDSGNMSSNKKNQVSDFLDKLNLVRNDLNNLTVASTDIVTLRSYYKSPQYRACQQQLRELETAYNAHIKSLIIKADDISEGRVPGRFHWHLGDCAKPCIEALDNLYEKHQQKINDLMGNMSDRTLVSDVRHPQQGFLMGQSAVRTYLDVTLPLPTSKSMSKTLFSASKSSIEAQRAILATQIMAGCDEDLPFLPPSIKHDENFKRGCLQELLLTVRHDAASSSEPISKLIRCLDPISEHFTIENKISAYIELLESVKAGQLKISSSDRQTQVEDVAEKLLYLAMKHNKTDGLSAVYPLIKSSTLATQFFKKAIKNTPADIEHQSIQELFHNLRELPRTADTVNKIESRLTQLQHDNITVFNGFARKLPKQQATDLATALKKDFQRFNPSQLKSAPATDRSDERKLSGDGSKF